MKAKRITALLMALIMALTAFGFTGCSDDEAEDNSEASESSVSETDDSFIPTNEALKITVPSCAVDIIEDHLYAYAASFGITDIRDGTSGSLVCFIETADKADVQMAAKKSLYDITASMASQTDYIISAEIGKECDSFTFFCEGNSYTEPSDGFFMSFYIPALTYHSLATPDKNFLFNKKMIFSFVDNSSYELLGEFEFNGIIEDEDKS